MGRQNAKVWSNCRIAIVKLCFDGFDGYVWTARSTQATSTVHKAALEEETRVIREKTTAAAATIEREISSANKVTIVWRLALKVYVQRRGLS